MARAAPTCHPPGQPGGEAPPHQMTGQPLPFQSAGPGKGRAAGQPNGRLHGRRLRLIMGKQFGHQPLHQLPIETPPDQLGPDAQRSPSFIEAPRPGPLRRGLRVIQIALSFELIKRGNDLGLGNTPATQPRGQFPFTVGATGQIPVGQLAGRGWEWRREVRCGLTPPLSRGWRRRSGAAGSFIDRTARS